MEWSIFVNLVLIGLVIAFPTLSVALGQGEAAVATFSMIDRQPAAAGALRRTLLLGLAFVETTAILSLFMVVLLLVSTHHMPFTVPLTCARLGIAIAFIIPSLLVGLSSAQPLVEAVRAIARQPLLHNNIMKLMLITQSFIQTPVIFALILGIMINAQLSESITATDALRLCSVGIAFGLGAIGPIIGLRTFARAACAGVGVRAEAYQNIFSFTFIAQAFIETPILFAFTVALYLLFMGGGSHAIAALAAAFAIGLSTLGAGISSGRTASAACAQIAENPNNYQELSRASMLSQALIDTCGIYGMIIAFGILLF